MDGQLGDQTGWESRIVPLLRRPMGRHPALRRRGRRGPAAERRPPRPPLPREDRPGRLAARDGQLERHRPRRRRLRGEHRAAHHVRGDGHLLRVLPSAHGGVRMAAPREPVQHLRRDVRLRGDGSPITGIRCWTDSTNPDVGVLMCATRWRRSAASGSPRCTTSTTTAGPATTTPATAPASTASAPATEGRSSRGPAPGPEGGRPSGTVPALVLRGGRRPLALIEAHDGPLVLICGFHGPPCRPHRRRRREPAPWPSARRPSRILRTFPTAS